MLCTKCKNNIADYEEFCKYCGAKQDNIQSSVSGFEPGAGMSNAQEAHNPGSFAGQAQVYFGNSPVNMQARGYVNNNISTRRPYSHSLTFSLIAVLLFVISYIISISALKIGAERIYVTSFVTSVFMLTAFSMSVAAIVLGALQLRKSSSAIGGFIVGIIGVLFYAYNEISFLVTVFGLVPNVIS